MKIDAKKVIVFIVAFIIVGVACFFAGRYIQRESDSSVIQELERGIAGLEKRRGELEDSITALDGIRDNLIKDNQGLRSSLERSQGEASKLRSELKRINSGIGQLENLGSSIEIRIDRIIKLIGELEVICKKFGI